jgi:CTP:molybdopterin cytidylyltransferase MocA
VNGAVITLGDQPYITPQVIAMVLDHYDGSRPVRAVYGGEPGHPVILTRALIRDAMNLRGDAGARDLLEQAQVRRIEAQHLCRPVDVDTPDDLERLKG